MVGLHARYRIRTGGGQETSGPPPSQGGEEGAMSGAGLAGRLGIQHGDGMAEHRNGQGSPGRPDRLQRHGINFKVWEGQQDDRVFPFFLFSSQVRIECT